MKAIRLQTAIPGPKSILLKKLREEHVPRAAFEVTPLFVEKAEGALLTDVDGNRFIDFAGGIGSINTGHSNPAVLDAMTKQMPRYLHTCFHVTMQEPYVALAQKLNEITPGKHAKKTLFFNSGAEAVENAVKLARYYTKRPAVVAFEHGYHGRTLLAMSLTSKVMPYKKGFGPFVAEIYRLPYPYLYRRPEGMDEERFIHTLIKNLQLFFKAQVDPDSVAAVIMELQTGEGGFIPAPEEYVQALKGLCEKHGILFIADEVQTGFARTGKMFASEHFQIVPDLMTMAKSLGGGMPISAVTGRAEILDAVHAGGLGGTFGGHPLSCVAGLAAIAYIEEHRLCARAKEIGVMMKKRLEKMKPKSRLIGDIRGLGAMVGIELVLNKTTKEPASAEAAEVVKRCYQRGLILMSCGVHGSVIRTLMPLVITNSQLEEGLDVLEGVLRELD